MQTLPLFRDLVLDTPATQSLKYIGSKRKLIPSIPSYRLIRTLPACIAVSASSAVAQLKSPGKVCAKAE